MSGLVALVVSALAFLVPLAVPLFAQRLRTFAIILAIFVVFFLWLNGDIASSPPGQPHWLGPFLGGLMLVGFTGGAIAKFVMLVSRRPEPPAGA